MQRLAVFFWLLAALTGSAHVPSRTLNSSDMVLNAHEYDYNAWGQRAYNRFKDGSRDEYEYDNIGQLRMAITYASNNAALLGFLQYGYDQAGNLAFRTNDLTTARAFATDRLNQLTNYGLAGTITVSGVTTTNATNVTVNGITATLNTNDGTYTASVPAGNGTNTLTAIGLELYGRRATNTVTIGAAPQYDANGSMVFDGTRAWAYDDENQLTSITETNSWKTEWVYDAFGRRRIRKEYAWVSGSWSLTNETRYVFDGLLVLQERDASNNPTVTYTRGLDLSGDMDGAGGIGGLLARTDANGSAFYHADAGGNITALINASQNLVAQYRYDPFGSVLSASGALAAVNELQFSSQPYHAKSRLNLFHGRPYSAGLGRFTQADPIGFSGGNNLHRFVGNDPVNEVDPFGWSDFNRPPDSVNDGGGVRYPHPTPDPAKSTLKSNLDPITTTMGWIGDGWEGTRSWLRQPGHPPFIQNLSGTMELGKEAMMWTMGGTEIKAGKMLIECEKVAKETTYLYQKVGAAGEQLKFGITGSPATRYTAAELNGGQLRIIGQGERSEMLRLERQLHETLPIGPEERQLFYIQKQAEQGLKSPPY